MRDKGVKYQEIKKYHNNTLSGMKEFVAMKTRGTTF